MTTVITKQNLDNPRMYDCCAHVTKGGRRCGALRWYHDDPGRARHRFVEPEQQLSDLERAQMKIAQLVEVLTAIRDDARKQQHSPDRPYRAEQFNNIAEWADAALTTAKE